jgi:hypothetical protein
MPYVIHEEGGTRMKKQTLKRMGTVVVAVAAPIVVLLLALTLVPLVGAGAVLAPPVLVDGHPAGNVFTAAVDTPVWATYDQDIDPATVDYRSFAVHAMGTGWLTETLAVRDGTIVLTPTGVFHPGEFVQVSATTETLSLGGEGPISPTVWQFWTAVDGGSVTFYDSGQRLGNDDHRGLSMGDLDGDGDLDAVAGGYNEYPSRVFLNDGTGVYSDTGQSLGSEFSLGISLGDLDGDGDLDVFEGSYARPNRVWWNDGAGYFTDSGQRLGDSNSFFAALGDLDGDGDLDVFEPNVGGEPNRVYLNDGSGIFTDSGQELGEEQSASVALGDLDGDGDLDAFVANGAYWSEANTVWINDGTGVFTDSGQLLGAGESLIVALGDLDGDRDLDAFVTNLNEPMGGEPDEVWINDGTGVFVGSGQLLGSGMSMGVALGDLDGDEDLDALVCQQEGGVVWLNDSGVFTDSGQLLNPCGIPGLGDLDGDGDLDSFMANGRPPNPNEVWFNADFGASLTPEASTGSGFPGHVVTYALVLANTGDIADTYTMTAASEWPAVGPSSLGPVDPGLGVGFVVTVTVPMEVMYGESDVATVTAISHGDPRAMASATLTTTVESLRTYLPMVLKN